MGLGPMPVQTRETPREPWPKPQPSRGSLSRSLSGRGPDSVRVSPLAETSGCAVRRPRCDPKTTVRSEDRSPRFRGVCRPFGLLAVSPLDDPEGSPLGLPTARCLRFPFGFGLNLPSGFPAFRFSLPFGFPSFRLWPSVRSPVLPAWPSRRFPAVLARRRVSPAT